MRHVKTLVLLIALFPTSTFAEGLGANNRQNNSQTASYDSQTQKLNADSDQLALSLLNRGTAAGTKRSPASDGFQVTMIKRTK